MVDHKIHAIIEYEDSYVQPLLLAAIQAKLPSELLSLIQDISELPAPNSNLLQWRQYESIDFDQLVENSSTSLANSYVIRKALIRKHYLSTTVSHWLTKHPTSLLKDHIKPSVEFEVDYAEFLDDALVDAFELKESWTKNEALDDDDSEEREWWILKPGMSDRGQGIRLFSSEEELQAIFEDWDPPSDDEDDEDDEDDDATSQGGIHTANNANDEGNGVITSQLRHFIAQPYIPNPLLLPSPHPSAGRKFHIRTYVLSVGALKVYVSKPMLALFAGHPYTPPSLTSTPNKDLSAHLTNTCLQSGEREGSVHAFWSLPAHVEGISSEDWKEDVFRQICSITGEVFEAAARSMGIHFQPLPNAFEIFGLDFMMDSQGRAWLLEVNAFPDFAQTGGELQDLVGELFQDVVEVSVKPFFGLKSDEVGTKLKQVLNIDLGRR
ncbi:hypothetical protein DOTSEDRAFT_134724 [Dothistroma septosporum NZE10]|uniref:Tubulin-tyrosine ligase n=1 Tax=Dothistroma septosporum (strain NZE10 / CBS 128990) TaxID=675120 RepID=N1PGP5_DOTSN|nr:hypothetical protein DOTSEDRAFT_134724 [Dothistroma septosporum NZE10]